MVVIYTFLIIEKEKDKWYGISSIPSNILASQSVIFN